VSLVIVYFSVILSMLLFLSEMLLLLVIEQRTDLAKILQSYMFVLTEKQTIN
jgi:hypothetical protein